MENENVKCNIPVNDNVNGNEHVNEHVNENGNEHVNEQVNVNKNENVNVARLQSQNFTMLKIALNLVLALPDYRSRRELPESSGIIDFENKNISVVAKH